MKAALKNVLEELVDEMTAEVSFTMHRLLMTGKLCLSCVELCAIDGYDVFGQPINNLNRKKLSLFLRFGWLTSPSTGGETFNCMNCGQRNASTRFAPHLEKCMGKGGRASARRTVPTAPRPDPQQERSEEEGYEDEDDGDVEEDEELADFYAPVRDGKAAKQQMHTWCAQGKAAVEVRAFFKQFCGVFSFENGNLCSGGLSCMVHSDEERRESRKHLMPPEEDT